VVALKMRPTTQSTRARDVIIRRSVRARAALQNAPEQEIGHRPQSSSASRLTAGASGFFILSQSGEVDPLCPINSSHDV